MCGISEDFLMRYVLLSLFLGTKSNISARIPLQTQCAHWGCFPSEEA